MASMRNTKAELLAMIEAYEARTANGPTFEEVMQAARAAGLATWREFKALTHDTWQAGVLARRAVSHVSRELSRPVLR